MIGLLSLTLASMPIKSVNMEWDREDPNQVIPAHEAPLNRTERDPDEIEPVRDIDQEAATKQDDYGKSEFIEMSPTQK